MDLDRISVVYVQPFPPYDCWVRFEAQDIDEMLQWRTDKVDRVLRFRNAPDALDVYLRTRAKLLTTLLLCAPQNSPLRLFFRRDGDHAVWCGVLEFLVPDPDAVCWP